MPKTKEELMEAYRLAYKKKVKAGEAYDKAFRECSDAEDAIANFDPYYTTEENFTEEDK